MLEKYFEFAALGTNWKQEIGAGVATFVTMAYMVLYFWNAEITPVPPFAFAGGPTFEMMGRCWKDTLSLPS